MEPTYPATNPDALHPDSVTVSELVADTLRRTKGWVRFLSILGFIGCGLMILGGLAMILGGMAGALGSSGSRGAMMGTAPLALMGFIYIGMAALYFVPALLLGRYASRIDHLIQTRTELDLVAALDTQRAFWKFVGIMTIVVMGIYALGIVIFMIIGITGIANL